MRRWGAFGSIALEGALLLLCAKPAIPNQHDVAADFSVVVRAGPAAYGTNVWWTDQHSATWSAQWAELSPSWVRLFVSHATVEPVNDNADPKEIDWAGFHFDAPIPVPAAIGYTMTYRDWFEALRDQPPVHVLVDFIYLAPWLTDNPSHPLIPVQAAPYPPNDLAEYGEFILATARYLVEEIGFPPERISFEVMNEPDLRCGADPVTPCFWQNWTMDDIRAVVDVTHRAIENVSPDIRLLGLAECCGTNIVTDLLDHYPEGDYLDGLSYHYYAPGDDMDTALSRAQTLARYGHPLYLDEYGSLQYQSEGTDAALWHSLALPTLWRAGIAPIQYPISESPLVGEPYSDMGLSEDWRGDWAPKPSYWVYTNFFQFLGGGEVISSTSPANLDVLVSRHLASGSAQATFWTVNKGGLPLANVAFTLHGFPASQATLQVYDNLTGPAPLTTETVQGNPLVFTVTVPARSSRALVLSTDPSPASVDHVLLSPDRAIAARGRAVTFKLTAYDALGRSWDVSRAGNCAISPEAGGTWVGCRYTSGVTGTWMVTGTYEGQRDSALLTIWQMLIRMYLPVTLRE